MIKLIVFIAAIFLTVIVRQIAELEGSPTAGIVIGAVIMGVAFSILLAPSRQKVDDDKLRW